MAQQMPQVELRPEQVVSPAQLQERIKNENIYVIDVRNPPEVEANGGFIKSERRVNIPLPELDEALNLTPETYKAKYGVEKPSGDGSDLVFHCFVGRRGGVAVSKAEKLGLTKASNLEGGFKSWLATNCQK